MRARSSFLILGLAGTVTACSVPDKHPTAGDGGVDSSTGDETAVPETMITSAPPDFSNSGPSTFKFSSTVPSSTFECSFDGETPIPCTSPYTRTLSDGSHNFSVRAINKLGKGDDSPAEHLWTIDTVAPSTMLIEVPPAADNSVMVRFGFRSSEENVTFDCSLDGNSYAPCESGTTFGPVGDGSHSFAVRAHDRAGNVDASPAIHAWSVDTSTPDTELLSGPDGAVGSTTATFTFVSPDAGAGATFQCSLDGSAMVACTSPYMTSTMSEGMHTFAVRVRDAVGNLNPTPATRVWTVDLAAPQTTIDSGPSGTVRIASASFTFSASEMNVTFQCSVDGGGYVPCTSPHNLANLGQGPHSFSVRATDAANHTDATPATAAWTVDTIAPDVTFASGPAEGATSGPRVVFGFTASEGATTCSVDQGPFAACASPFGINLPAGPHTFRVQAADAAGNVTTATRSWTIACGAPPAAGAAGLLHLEDSGQTLANETGGAPATLGTNDTVEAADPTFGPGRYGNGAVFAAGDLITWPLALAAAADTTVDLWLRPDGAGGTHDVVTNSNASLAVRVTQVSMTNVRITASVTEAGGAVRVAQSAPVAAGAWHHVLLSVAGPTLRLWVDGARTEVAVSGGAPTLDTLKFGATYGGALDEVWVAQTGIADDEAALGRYCPL